MSNDHEVTRNDQYESVHTTKKNIDRFKREVEYMRNRWGHLLANDPFYSPNFSLRYANCSPRLPGERPMPPLE